MFDLVALVKAAGYLGVFGIIFAESGLLIGAFLPGDSLLFTAGVLASQRYFYILVFVFISFIGAVTGDGVGYWLGRKFGPKVFMRKDSLFFSNDHVERAHIFYKKYGGRAIILARFIPVGGTPAPLISGGGGGGHSTGLFFN